MLSKLTDRRCYSIPVILPVGAPCLRHVSPAYAGWSEHWEAPVWPYAVGPAHAGMSLIEGRTPARSGLRVALGCFVHRLRGCRAKVRPYTLTAPASFSRVATALRVLPVVNTSS